MPPTADDADLAQQSRHEHGDVLTKRWVVDLQPQSLSDVDAHLFHHLCWSGVDAREGSRLVSSWLRCDDYLPIDHPQSGVDFVVGNPP